MADSCSVELAADPAVRATLALLLAALKATGACPGCRAEYLLLTATEFLRDAGAPAPVAIEMSLDAISTSFDVKIVSVREQADGGERMH